MKQIIIFLMLPMFLWSANAVVVGKAVEVIGKKAQSYNGIKTHRITMDLDVLRNTKNFKEKQAIVINIDDNKSLTFIPKRFEAGKKEGDFSWVGQSEDGSAKAILSVRNGVLIGTLICKDGKYKIYPQNGHFKVIKIDPTMVIPFHGDMFIEPERIMIPISSPKEEKQTQEDSVQESETSSNVPQKSSVVTLLVYYTQALEDKYGTDTEAMIQANIDLAKDAYIESDTDISLQVVKLKKVPAGSLLSTANPDNLNDLLNKLRADGVVRYEREYYGADAVTVFSKHPGTSGGCGLGQTPRYDTDSLVGAYTAVHILPPPENPSGSYSLCSDLSFAHELGHNFGCFHDSDHASGTPMYAYAYGYDIANKFATIMSYDNPEINFFSNPRINHTDGTPIGDASIADNARTIKENQHKMADNSEQISEALEANDNDTLDAYAISGTLNSQTDRDGYVVWLEGDTTLDKSYQGFYMNIYNEDTHQLLGSYSSDLTTTFPKGRYRVVISFFKDSGNSYYVSDGTYYSVDISTQYVPPVIVPVNPAIINYLLN